MKTYNQLHAKAVRAELAPLGFSTEDLGRVAKRLTEGTQGDRETFLTVLCNSIQNSDARCRITGNDLVIYGPEGYAICDARTCEIQYCSAYTAGITLDRAVAHIQWA